jgi:NhaA family Na+:H+ antiporter
MSDSPTPLHERAGRALRGVRSGFAAFFALETSGSIVLLAATVIALVLANTGAYGAMSAIGHAKIGIQVGPWSFSEPILGWIDDGLMAIFFFVIGLEIKREVTVGELSTPRKAALPILAAVGGMVAPALIYLAIAGSSSAAHGWGIPMATDIAFALGVLAFLGRRAPKGLRLFLTALAIADDLGAIIVIAIFYAHGFSVTWLLAGLALLALLVMLNRLGVDSPIPYVLIGIVVWFAFLNSGIHATIAGVLVAFTIPTSSRMDPLGFVSFGRERLDEIEAIDVPGAHVLMCDEQQEIAFDLRRKASYAAAPLQRLEHALHPWTTFFVLPLFALANAGVRLVGVDVGAVITQPVVLGVFFGMLLGKPIGISLTSWLAVRLGVADLPSGVAWRHIIGGGILGAIGFTMSLFIDNLAFKDPVLLAEAKVAILATSLVAGVVGYLYLRAMGSGGGEDEATAAGGDVAPAAGACAS